MSIAIAGHLNIALYGPPGSGKTLLAQSSILLSPKESETSRKQRSLIYSVSDECFPERYPFRQPPSSISLRSMFGGGTSLTLGEVTLAHTGFLFMDEFPDFKNEIMMSLKKVLDLRTSVIFHQKNIIKLPADFILITAMNNCPCGYWGHPKKECTCQEYKRKQYLTRISTALWDRIELHVDMKPQSVGTTLKESNPNYLQTMKKNIEAAVNMQEHRKNRNDNISLSSAFSKYPIQPGAREMLHAAQLSLGLSTRKLLHTFRIARTIADLEQVESIKVDHIEEALSYRKQEY